MSVQCIVQVSSWNSTMWLMAWWTEQSKLEFLHAQARLSFPTNLRIVVTVYAYHAYIIRRLTFFTTIFVLNTNLVLDLNFFYEKSQTITEVSPIFKIVSSNKISNLKENLKRSKVFILLREIFKIRFFRDYEPVIKKPLSIDSWIL